MKITFKTTVWSVNSIIIFLILSIALSLILESRFPMIFRGSYKKHDRGLIVGKTSDKADSLDVNLQHLMYQSPKKIKYSNYHLMEIIVLDKDLPRDIKDDIKKMNDYSIYMIGATVNVVFFDKERKDIHKLIDSYGYIKHISYPNLSRYRYSEMDNDKRNYILYEMSLKDTNGDDRINNKDSTAFFISDLAGRNLRQITPFSLHFSDFSYSEDFNQIYFEILENLEDKDVLGHQLKSRKISYYNVKTDKYFRFAELDKIINSVQQQFKL